MWKRLYENAGFEVGQRVMLLLSFLIRADVLIGGLIVANLIMAEDPGIWRVTFILAGVILCASAALALTARGATTPGRI